LRLRQPLSDQAVRDALTGLFNRRYMEETLAREVRRAVRRDRPLALLMLDLDHFKRYNDRYGHAAGDSVLRAVGAFPRARIRSEDIPCRYGGEEFVVILPEATPDHSLHRAEEIRAGVKQLTIVHDARQLDNITTSIGLASVSAEVSESSSLLRAADAALYPSKEKGRDRVTVASSPPAPRSAEAVRSG
jgi:diguanylate cyclase (GGDEF)-like protein